MATQNFGRSGDIDRIDSNTGTLSTELSSDIMGKPVKCELLCFAMDKSRILSFDDLVKVCSDFYTFDEICEARQIVENCTNIRMTKRKGNDKCRASVEDIVKIVLDPAMSLPVCYATDLSRLPPTDISHCDITAIMRELQLLRAEVRDIQQLRDEVCALRTHVAESRDAVARSPCMPDGVNVTQGSDAAGIAEVSRDSATGNASFAGLTRRLAQDPSAFQNVARAMKNKLIVGASSDNKRLKVVMTKRNVDVFISRLHPETSPHELVDCVRSVGDGVKICDVTCTKLQSKYEHLYSSYHAAISVDTADIKRAVDVFMSADVWPCGVFVKRYFNRRNGSEPNQQ